jgi:hypothetical protein
MRRHIGRAALLAALVPFTACDIFGSSNSDFMREQLVRAEQRWDSNGSSNYTLLVTRRCDCPIEPRQVALEVVDDQLVGATYTDSGETLDTDALGQYATVRGMFALARDAVDRRVPVILVEYNQEFGYIDDLTINYDQTRIDDDILITVQDYIPS